MLSIQELRRIASAMSAETFERQLGPFVLVQRPTDLLVQQRSLELGARKTLSNQAAEMGDSLSLLFELDHLWIAPLPSLEHVDALTVGRLPDCEIVVDDPSVSKRHAQLSWAPGSTAAFLNDLGSSNGTTVNGAAIRGSQQIQDGDEIAFGNARFCFLRTLTLHMRLTTGRFTMHA